LHLHDVAGGPQRLPGGEHADAGRREERVLLRPQWPGVPKKRVLEQIELIGQELIPSLKSA
jgi:hypothetical protein